MVFYQQPVKCSRFITNDVLKDEAFAVDLVSDIIQVFEEAHKIPDRLVFKLSYADGRFRAAFVTKCSVDGIRFATCPSAVLNLLKPTSYVMHQQFNIQQLYALSTLYLYVLYLSENKQRLVPLTA